MVLASTKYNFPFKALLLYPSDRFVGVVRTPGLRVRGLGVLEQKGYFVNKQYGDKENGLPYISLGL